MFSNGRNTQALRLQQFTRTISTFRNRAMAIRCKPSTKPAEMVEPNQCSLPNQCSNINFSGPSLSEHAHFDRPRHPEPRVMARRGFYFRSARIVIVTHRSANEKESASRLGSPGLPDLLFRRQISQIWLFFKDSWRQKIVRFFLNICFFWRQLAHAIRLVSLLFKYLAENCY